MKFSFPHPHCSACQSKHVKARELRKKIQATFSLHFCISLSEKKTQQTKKLVLRVKHGTVDIL